MTSLPAIQSTPDTTKMLTYVLPFFNIMHERVKRWHDWKMSGKTSWTVEDKALPTVFPQ